MITENFMSSSNATLTVQGALTPAPSVFTSTSGISISGSTALYWDPNGSTTNCNMGDQGNSGQANPTLVNITGGCVGTYLVGGSTTNEGHQYAPIASATPTITIAFANPVYGASFVFALPGNGIANGLFTVTLKNSGGQTVDTFTAGTGNLLNAAAQYLDISNEGAFSSIVISQAANAYSGNSLSFNALIANLSATTTAPEPGTIGLLGLGLAGIGYFARRRKA